MDKPKADKRRKPRKAAPELKIARIGCKDGLGHTRWLTADVVDSSHTGAGLSLARPLQVGEIVEFRAGGEQTAARARVIWCREDKDGSYAAGVEFLEAEESAKPAGGAGGGTGQETDYYEVMQLSPNADLETIHRVYRILAQRYHPDNASTGNEAMFLRLGEAYAVLGDPELRAAYDARHGEMRQARRRVLAEMAAAGGPAAEREKRRAVLDLLYAKTLHDFEHPTLTIQEMEDFLGCPREHLQAALWFLKGKRFIQRSDNGRYSLTVDGFEEAESGAASGGAALRGRLLTESRAPAAG